MDRLMAEQIYLRHHRPIHQFLRKMTRDPQLAEELTQDVFVRVIRGLDAYDPRDREAAWLFRIARRVLADSARTARRRPALVAATDREVSAGAPIQSTIAALEEALGRLDDGEREVFLLRELGGLGYDEISRLTGVTPDAVRNRIHRARCRLRLILMPPSVIAKDQASRGSR